MKNKSIRWKYSKPHYRWEPGWNVPGEPIHYYVQGPNIGRLIWETHHRDRSLMIFRMEALVDRILRKRYNE